MPLKGRSKKFWDLDVSPSGWSMTVEAGMEEGAGTGAAAAEQSGRILWLVREVGRRMGVRAGGRGERRAWLGTVRERPAGGRRKAWVVVIAAAASISRASRATVPFTAAGMVKTRFIGLAVYVCMCVSLRGVRSMMTMMVRIGAIMALPQKRHGPASEAAEPLFGLLPAAV